VLDLRRLLIEGLDHANALNVLVDDRGQLRLPGGDDPLQREDLVPEPNADPVDERQWGDRHEGEWDVDEDHDDDGEDEHHDLHGDEGTEGEQELDRTNVGVGSADDLTALGSVPEIERELREALVHQVSQIVLDPERRPEQPEAVGETEDEADHRQDRQNDHEGRG